MKILASASLLGIPGFATVASAASFSSSKIAQRPPRPRFLKRKNNVRRAHRLAKQRPDVAPNEEAADTMTKVDNSFVQRETRASSSSSSPATTTTADYFAPPGTGVADFVTGEAGVEPVPVAGTMVAGPAVVDVVHKAPAEKTESNSMSAMFEILLAPVKEHIPLSRRLGDDTSTLPTPEELAAELGAAVKDQILESYHALLSTVEMDVITGSALGALDCDTDFEYANEEAVAIIDDALLKDESIGES
eukprot:g3307.t1